MDNRSIFSKTGKGSLEIAKKALKLSSEERQALILVDGKSCYEDLQEKLSRIQPVKLRAVFERLLGLELIREFVGKSGGQNAASGYASTSQPAPAATTAASLLDDGEELDFTSLAPAASVSNDIAALRQATAEAEKARQLREAGLHNEQTQKAAEEAARAHAAEEAARASREEALRKVQAHKAAQAEAARARAAEEQARIKAESDQLAAEQRAREEKERQEREEVARLAAEEEAKRKAETEARIKAEADRLVREQRAIQEKERQEREEAARVAAEQEAKRKAEEERIAREQREREEAARRAAEEEAKREAEEEARVTAEAERLAREQLEREARERREAEEAQKRAAEEEMRQKAETARHAAEEEARIKAEAARLAQEQMERENAERREREEAPKRAAEEATRRAAEEEAERKAGAEARAKAEAEAQRKAEAERLAREQRELEARQRAEKDKQVRDRLAREQEERARAEREAAAKQAASTKQAEAAAVATAAAVQQTTAPAAGGDDAIDFAPASPEQRRKDEVAQLLAGSGASKPAGTIPLTGGGPDTFADTGPEVDPFADDDHTHGNEQALASRREIEREAKERADARAEPASAAEHEHEAEPAHEDAAPAKMRRSGGSLPIGKIIGTVIALALVGGIGYLFMMPVDKPAIERALSERLGEAVTVDAAKFSPFPPVLTLSGMNIGPVKLNTVAAHTELSSLFSSQKNWKSVDIGGLSIDAAAARNLIALGGREVPKVAAGRVQIQRVHLTNTEISGMPVAVPKFNVEILLMPSGALKQITLSTTDDKARAILQPDDKGWGVDIESKGMVWPAGPKIAWDSLRAKGIGSANGIKFDDYTITHFGGVSRGAGELGWNGGWRFNGNLDPGALDSEAIAQAFYEAAPVSGSIEGKLSISMSGASLPRMFDAPQIDGALSVSKAILKNVDLARTAQTGATASGSTRFTDFSTTIALAGGKLQLKDIKGVSGLLTVSGNAQLDAGKNVTGGLLVELGVGGSRAKANVKLSGTMAEPKLAK